jgi:hypothetical protein
MNKTLVSFAFFLCSNIYANQCFHGWVSERGNTTPTGYCSAKLMDGRKVSTYIEVDFPTQTVFIHGKLTNTNEQNGWFRYTFSECHDIDSQWTSVAGVNQITKNTFLLTHREINEIEATGEAKRAFLGEAELDFKINGEVFKSTLSCIRYEF